MKKELGVHPYLFPMPVLMIATYGDDDTVDVMNMAWGGICAENMVSLNIDEGHKTSENIKKRGAFTLSIADIPHIEAADFFGIASGNKMANKFERSGLTAVKSEKVDAPIVQEFPLTLECTLPHAAHPFPEYPRHGFFGWNTIVVFFSVREPHRQHRRQKYTNGYGC